MGPGDLLEITGPNGSGKSSLLKVLCGLLLPDEGRVKWNGSPIERARGDFHLGLSYLAHRNGFSLDLTPVENLSADLRLRGSDRLADIATTLARVGLDGVADLPVRHLSAGQQRRAAFARTVLHGASAWLLDEPSANLDVAGRGLIEELIAEQLTGGGLVIIAAHHALGRVMPTQTLELG